MRILRVAGSEMGILLVLSAVMGCGVFAQPASIPGAARIDLPAEESAGLTWLDSRTLVTSVAPGPPPGQPAAAPQLWSIDVDGGQGMAFGPIVGETCVYTAYRAPEGLSDGRLGAVKECGDPAVRPPLYPTTVVAIDADTGDEEMVADFATLGMSRNFLPIVFTYDPATSIGLASVYGGVCAGLVWLDGGSVRPVDDVFVGEGDQRFALGAPVVARGGSECAATGQAAWPDISADGRSIAFLASPDSVGKPIADRWDQPWGLYVMDATKRDPTLLLSGLRHPRGVQWSPDGATILVAGDLDSEGAGTWVVTARGGAFERVAPMVVDWLSWNPDGSAFAALDTPIPPDGSVPDTTHLYVVPMDK